MLVPQRLRLDSQVNYDFENRLLQLQRHIMTWSGNCYSLRIEYGDFLRGEDRDSEFRFAVTFKNVGTFFDITGGDSEEL
jgi:hypothetical protein